MPEYRLADNVILQRNARVPKGSTVAETVMAEQTNENSKQHLDPLDPDAVFMALSLSGRHYMLNLSASLILELLLEGREALAIRDFLIDVFDVPEEQVASDIEDCIQMLTGQGFLVN